MTSEYLYPRSGDGKLRLEVIDSFETLNNYADDWNRLAFEAPHRLPTISYAWVSSYIEYLLLPGETWCCILAFDNDQLIGLLPVIISPHHLLGLNRPRIRAPQNKHTYSVDFVCTGGREKEVIPAILGVLRQIQPRFYDFSLIRLPESSPTISTLPYGARNCIAIREYDGAGSYLRIDGSFDDFRKKLSRNFSRNLSKAHNKLARLPDVRAVFLSGPDATEKELDLFMHAEASGWKATAGTAIRNSQTLVTFYRALTRRMSQLGWLEWHFLQSQDRVLAAQLAIKMKSTLIVLKIGYDEEYSYCSPGNALFESTVERAYKSGDTEEINCITDMPWHDNWGMLKRPHYNLWIYPRRPMPIMIGALGRKAKIQIRSMPGFPLLYRQIKGLMKGD